MDDNEITVIVTGAPETIWLVYGDLERDDTHANCYREGDVGWCDESQSDADVRYVRADVAEAEIERLRAVLAEAEQDVTRYHWLRRRVPGGTYRIIGVVYSEGGDGVDAAIDEAMASKLGAWR